MQRNACADRGSSGARKRNWLQNWSLQDDVQDWGQHGCMYARRDFINIVSYKLTKCLVRILHLLSCNILFIYHTVLYATCGKDADGQASTKALTCQLRTRRLNYSTTPIDIVGGCHQTVESCPAICQCLPVESPSHFL